MFTMTATKSSTCPLSGLTIEPGDTITRTGNKYTPWHLTKSEIDRKQRVARAVPQMMAPELEQYHKIKQRFPDTVLLFRVGDWYETYKDDAKIVADVCVQVMTRRNNAPLTGIPYAKADEHIARLINAGHKVAICEQIGEVTHNRGKVEPTPVLVACFACGTMPEPGDAYCAECGIQVRNDPEERTIHQSRREADTRRTARNAEAMATSAKQERKERLDAYTIATDDEQPTVIAEVRHIEAPAPKALLGFSTPKRDVVIAEPTPEPIAPQNAPESRTDGPTPLTADTITEQYAYISPKDFVSLMAGATKLVRDDIKQARADAKAEGTKYDSFHGLRESVRIVTLPDGTIYAGQLMGDDAGQTTCTKGTGIDACFDQDQASALARYLIDTKSRIPRMVRLSIEGKYLVIEQESTVKGRWDKMRFAHQIEPTNTGQMSGWPVRQKEQQAA